MASSAGARSPATGPKTLRTVAEMLLSSENGPPVNKLAGVDIDPNASQSLKKMASYLGLPNADANAIQPRTLTAPNTRGPSLLTVQRSIIEGESYGDGKYSDEDLNMKDWKEADHYSLCLYRLCVFNSSRRSGIFVNRQMSEAEKQVRLWMCMVRATADANRLVTRTKAQKRKSLSIDEDSTAGGLLDQPSASMFGEKFGNLVSDINSTPCKSRKQHQFSFPQSSLMDKFNHSMRSLDQAT
ncbi:uncharacterized protein EAE97_002471 [Botrytis byssoidea]|uniref:Uncharacterized protein n=1 Tax=Botrytis byssoidea TaxID=139641 RepID=A0A9P5IVJ9_9HELO|nr:uncharacterized protein EAE97_002471 [Botrytis byssoidea]KAF7950919.1 hypothetical protein EAE97_002471 [Botrytis byssoidea]